MEFSETAGDVEFAEGAAPAGVFRRIDGSADSGTVESPDGTGGLFVSGKLFQRNGKLHTPGAFAVFCSGTDAALPRLIFAVD